MRGDVTAIFLKSKKHGDMETLISTNKLHKADELPSTWYAAYSKRTKTFYVQGNSPIGDGKRETVFLHRWITNAPKGMQVDHFDHEPLINTDFNLRIVTQGENLQNINGAYANSKSGIRGVSWRKQHRKWMASITIDKKLVNLGHFDNIEDAQRVAIEARIKHMPYSNETLSS